MIACRLSRRSVWAATFALVASPALAQYGTATPDTQPNNYPPALPARRGPGPALVFERLGEIKLPGPLGAASGFAADGLVVISVEGGWVRVAPETDATPTIVPAVNQAEAPDWIVSSNGKRRFRTTPEGLVLAERRSRGRKRWVSAWRIVAPNSIVAPPLLVGLRLCYAGLDDRVTCVRASNGHRLWTVDLGDRLSRGLTAWPAGGDDRTIDGEILLAVPDDGASVIALDAYDGRRVASFELPATHHFASSAIVVSRDRIAIARKGYEDREAALVLFRLTRPPPAAAPRPVSYNDGSPARTGPSGR